jgi:hypothetical protein
MLGVHRADRVPVHGRTVERWQILRGHEVSCGDTTEGAFQADHLRTAWARSRSGEEAPERLVDRGQ